MGKTLAKVDGVANGLIPREIDNAFKLVVPAGISSLRCQPDTPEVKRLESLKYWSWMVLLLPGLCLSATKGPDMLFVTRSNCKLITGYGKHDLQGVAKEFKVKPSSIRYLRAEWGKAQDGSEQCNMVFSTPKGNKSCKVFNIMHDEFTFGLAVPIPGNHAICNN
jgi:hypothetical protein